MPVSINQCQSSDKFMLHLYTIQNISLKTNHTACHVLHGFLFVCFPTSYARDASGLPEISQHLMHNENI